MILYRPVGMHELRLILESEMTAFPPRLPEQPIFYPVLNIDYARQIAFRWNTKEKPYAGYVTEFQVLDDYIRQFDSKIVGARLHEELWIPAEDLCKFNKHILGKIKVVDADFGVKFIGFVDDNSCISGVNAIEQFVNLSKRLPENLVNSSNSTLVYLNYPYWQERDLSKYGIDRKQKQLVLDEIQKSWTRLYPTLQLGI